MVKRLLLIVGALLMASPAWSAYYDMTEQPNGSGYRALVYETVTTSDYLRAPARGFNRIAFTKGSTAQFELFACETKEYSASTCTSITTLSATSDAITVETGRPWLLFDVTVAETAGSVSYITIQSNKQNAGSGGGGGGVLGVGPLAEMQLSSPSGSRVLWQQTDDNGTGDCASTGGNTVIVCQWDGDSWEPVDQAGGVTGLTNPLVANLDPDGYSIGARVFYASTEAEINSALTAIGSGVGTANQRGAIIQLEGGVIDIASTIVMSGSQGSNLGRSGVVLRGAGGGGASNSDVYPDQGTILRWVGAAGDNMIEVGSCPGCVIERLSLAGACVDKFNTGGPPQTGGTADGLCDFDGATTRNVAAHGIKMLDIASLPSKIHVQDVGISMLSSYAIDGNTSGQWDESQFNNTHVSYTDGCARVRQSQSIGIVFGPNFICTQQNSTTNPMFELTDGEIMIDKSYLGFTLANQVGVHVGTTGDGLRFTNNAVELNNWSGATAISMNDTPANGQEKRATITGNDFKFSGSGTIVADIALRGIITFTDNRAVQTNGTLDLTPPTLSFARDTGSGVNRTYLVHTNNTITLQNETVFYHFPKPWMPTIGAGVYTNAGILATATLPSTSGADCLDGQPGVDIDDGALKTCKADAWIDPPNLTAAGTALPLAGGLMTGEIQSNGDLTFRIDANNDGSNFYRLKNGAGDAMILIDETGSFSSSGSAGFSSLTATSGTITSGNLATVRGSVSLIGGDTGGFPVSTFRVLAPLTGTSSIDLYLPDALGTNGHCLKTDGAGTTSWGACGGSGDVATDTIWNVAGDLVYGTGSDTATRLGIGTAGQVLEVNGGATAPQWATIPGGSNAGGVNALTAKTTPVSGDLLMLEDSAASFAKKRLDVTNLKKLHPTQTECFTLYAPVDTISASDDIQSLWRAPAAITITEVWCETDTGTITADFQIDDGTPAYVVGSFLSCTSSGASSGTIGVSMADGDRLDQVISTSVSSPTRFTICAEYTY